MKKLMSILLLIMPLATHATLIDFDVVPGGGSIASGTEITNQYSFLGVTFSALEDGSIVSGPYALQEFAARTPHPPSNSGNAL